MQHDAAVQAAADFLTSPAGVAVTEAAEAAVAVAAAAAGPLGATTAAAVPLALNIGDLADANPALATAVLDRPDYMRHAFRDALVRLGVIAADGADRVWLRPSALPLRPRPACQKAVLDALRGRSRAHVLLRGVVAAAAPPARVLYVEGHACRACQAVCRVPVGPGPGNYGRRGAIGGRRSVVTCDCGAPAWPDASHAEFLTRRRLWLEPFAVGPPNAVLIDSRVCVDVLDDDLAGVAHLGAHVVVAGVATVAAAPRAIFGDLRVEATNVWNVYMDGTRYFDAPHLLTLALDPTDVGRVGSVGSGPAAPPSLASLLADLRTAAGVGLSGSEAALLAMLLSASTTGARPTPAGRAQVHVRVSDAGVDPAAFRGILSAAAVLAGDGAVCPPIGQPLLPRSVAAASGGALACVEGGSLLSSRILILSQDGLPVAARVALAAALRQGSVVPNLPANAIKAGTIAPPAEPVRGCVWLAGVPRLRGDGGGGATRTAAADRELEAEVDVTVSWFGGVNPCDDADAALDALLMPPPPDAAATERVRACLAAAVAGPTPVLGPDAVSALQAYFVASRCGAWDGHFGVRAASTLARLATASARLHRRPHAVVMPDVALAVALHEATSSADGGRSCFVCPPAFGPRALSLGLSLDARLRAVAAALAKLGDDDPSCQSAEE